MTLPSLLADGNIPALARKMDLEFIFLTEEKSWPLIRGSTAATAIERYCQLRPIFIDDLILPNYGVVLTKAYFRSVNETGATARDHYYFFLNVDSILANGSYATVLERIESGSELIFAPGVRVNGPAVIDRLTREGHATAGSLSIEPRVLAKIALENLHDTVRSQRLTQKFTHLDCPYHHYWQIRPDAVHMAQFLMANICFRPTQVPKDAICYVDYCIRDAFVPGAPITILNDSDEFLLVEPQEPGWMSDRVWPGMRGDSWYTREASKWMTAQHIELGQTICSVHSGPLDAEDTALIGRATRHVERLAARLQPHSIYDHPFWLAGLRSFDRLHELKANGNLPKQPLVASFKAPLIKHESLNSNISFRRRLVEAMGGRGHRKTILHPRRQAFRELFRFTEGSEQGRTLYLFPTGSANLVRRVPGSGNFFYEYLSASLLIQSVISEPRSAVGTQLLADLAKSSRVVLLGIDTDLSDLPHLARWLHGIVRDDCEILLHFGGSEIWHLARNGNRRLCQALDIEGFVGDAKLVGNGWGSMMEFVYTETIDAYKRKNYLGCGAGLLAVGLLAPLVAATNLWRSSAQRPGRLGVQSVIVTLYKTAPEHAL